jgi:hypothetical protein
MYCMLIDAYDAAFKSLDNRGLWLLNRRSDANKLLDFSALTSTLVLILDEETAG